MRALVHRGPMDLRLEKLAMPVAGLGETLVQVKANGLCGSDLHLWHLERGPEVTAVLGHEICGMVIKPDGTRTLAAIHGGDHCGACVHCDAGFSYYCRNGVRALGSTGSHPGLGGLAEFLVAPSTNVIPVPHDLDPAIVTLAEPLANALRSLDRPEIREAASLVVIGCGPLGLVHIAAAKHYGIKHVVAVEGRAKRAAAALALGADSVVDPADDVARELAKRFPIGPDVIVEAAGLATTAYQAFTLVRPGGSVVLMGICGQPFRINTFRWIAKELTIRTSIGTGLSEHQLAMDILASGAIDTRSLITARVRLEDAAEAFAALEAGADEIKVVVIHD